MPAFFEEHAKRGDKALSHERYDDALTAFESALNASRAPHERARALDGMANACFHLERHERALELLDEAIGICEPGAESDRPSTLALARALYDKGGMLAQLGRPRDALHLLELLISRFADQASTDGNRDEGELGLRFMIVKAMGLKATALRKLHRDREAVACYDDMIRRFEPVDEAAIEDMVARGMRNRAWLLGELGRQDEEIAAYDNLVARYGDNHLLSVSHTILDALAGKMQIYCDREAFEQALAPCDEIIRRYHFDPGAGIAERVARAMIHRGNFLNKLGRKEDELAAYDQVALMYGHFEEPEVRLHAAKALMFKAVSLGDAGQSAAEIECYEDVLRRFADDEDDQVRAVAADALIYKGLSRGALAADAAQDIGVPDIGAEIACYDEVVGRYGAEQSIVLKRAVAEALLRKAEALLEANRGVDAAMCLETLVASGAEINDDDLAGIIKEARALQAKL